jgi:hypothetical protein
MESPLGSGKLSLLFAAAEFQFFEQAVALKLHWVPKRTGVFRVR